MKKLSQTLRAYNLQMRTTILVCGVLKVEGVCTTKIVQIQQGSTELRMWENRVLVLPVNILTVWRAGFTWPHDTLPCVLIYGVLFAISPCSYAVNVSAERRQETITASLSIH